MTDEFVGFTGTTPRPVPERPDDPTTGSALEYALAYERYYLAYRAMYALGPQTPDDQTDGPAHDFPDVRLGEMDAEATQRSDDRVVVSLWYDRLFEGESQGEFTVEYSVSVDKTARAATDGRVSEGLDLAENGRIQHCGDKRRGRHRISSAESVQQSRH